MADRNALTKTTTTTKKSATKKTKRSTSTLTQLLAQLRERGTMTLSPELVEIVAGGRVRGSWWSHPKGKEIFRLANELEDVVLTAKLIDGKTTFVDGRLYPALYRVVTDLRWRRSRRAEMLDKDSRTLLLRVERVGRLRVDAPSFKESRKRLEASLLVRSTQEHTESGHHAVVLESWRAWATGTNAKIARAAAKLSLEDAHAMLLEARISLEPHDTRAW